MQVNCADMHFTQKFQQNNHSISFYGLFYTRFFTHNSCYRRNHLTSGKAAVTHQLEFSTAKLYVRAYAHVLHCSCVSCEHFCLYERHSKNTPNSSVTKMPARKNEFLDESQKEHVLCNRIIAFTHFALVNAVVKS